MSGARRFLVVSILALGALSGWAAGCGRPARAAELAVTYYYVPG